MAQTDKSKNERRLAVSVVGSNRPGLALDLITDITNRGCVINDCHITPMADCIAINLLIAGNWSALGRLETALPKLADKLDINIQYQNAGIQGQSNQEYRPYAAEVIAPVQNDLLTKILDFFQGQSLLVHELVAQEYQSTQTGAAMCTMSLVVYMPLIQHPQALRESFMDLCDELNADGILDPIKN